MLDEGNGVSAGDAVGGNEGTLRNGGVWRGAEGMVNGGLEFDGVDDAMEVAASGMSAEKGSFAAWVKGLGFGNGAQYILGHTTLPAWGSRIQLYANGNNGTLNLGMGDSHAIATNIATLGNNTWRHIVLTWKAGVWKVYVDGSIAGSGSYAGFSEIGGIMDVGNNGNLGSRSEAFRGIIDDVRFFNYAIGADEVGGIYAETYTPKIDTDSVTILSAEYNNYENKLEVDATSTMQPGAVLTVLGHKQMEWESSDGLYECETEMVSPPAAITVISNKGGTATANVSIDLR